MADKVGRGGACGGEKECRKKVNGESGRRCVCLSVSLSLIVVYGKKMEQGNAKRLSTEELIAEINARKLKHLMVCDECGQLKQEESIEATSSKWGDSLYLCSDCVLYCKYCDFGGGEYVYHTREMAYRHDDCHQERRRDVCYDCKKIGKLHISMDLESDCEKLDELDYIECPECLCYLTSIPKLQSDNRPSKKISSFFTICK